MQAEKQESWNIIVSAKSKNFDFKLKAKKISPTWKLQRVSIFLKLRQFILRLKSDSAASSPFPRRRRSLKSRILAVVEKFRRRRGKKVCYSKGNPQTHKPDTKMKSLMNRLKYLGLGILVFLLESIYEKDQRVILVVGSVVLLYFLTLMKKNITGKYKTVLAFSVISVATAVCVVMFGFKTFLNYDLGCILQSLFGSHGNV